MFTERAFLFIAALSLAACTGNGDIEMMQENNSAENNQENASQADLSASENNQAEDMSGPAQDMDEVVQDMGGGEDGGANKMEDMSARRDEGQPVEDMATAPDLGDDRVAMFVAQGHMGRTVISCDDGKSWVAESSLDDSARCFTDGLDCDHTTGAGRGISFGNGYFMATFGWGEPGGIKRSEDGVTWTEVLSGTTFGGVVHGQGKFVTGSRTPRYSTDDGMMWSDATNNAIDGWNVRRMGFVNHDGGRFIIVADGEAAYSKDGITWEQPTSWPDGCGGNIQTSGGIAYDGQGVILVVGGRGVACRSLDGGVTWEKNEIGSDVSGQLQWVGDKFMTWSRGKAHSSTDGASWSSEDTSPGSVHPGPTSYNPDTGTIVAVRGGWQNWYDKQEFYRSADGVTWEVLADDKFTGSHPVRDMTFGHGKSSPVCP